MPNLAMKRNCNIRIIPNNNNKASWPHSLTARPTNRRRGAFSSQVHVQVFNMKRSLSMKDKTRINFIFLGDVDGASFESAHNLQVPSTVREQITHHNSLSATLTVKRKK